MLAFKYHPDGDLMSADITPYLDLVPSRNRNKKKFIAVLSEYLQPVADTTASIASMPALFDLDTAVGDQLDGVAQWIGGSRKVKIPIPSVFFSFDTPNVGFDQAAWYQPGDPTSDLFSLPDDAFRLLLRVKVVNNQWDGSIPHAYELLDSLFSTDSDFKFYIQDNGDLTMNLGLGAEPPPDTLTQALLLGGYLDIRPAGVLIKNYFVEFGDGPIFALDPGTLGSAYAGLDLGYWTT